MKKAALILFVAAFSAFGQTRGVGLELGYTSVAFRKLNNMLDDSKDSFENRGYSVDKTEFGSAIYFCAYYDHPIQRQFTIGPKIEYIRLFSSEFDANMSGSSFKSVRSAWLVPLLVGGKFFLPISNPYWSFWGGAYIGQAFGGTLEEVERDNYFGSDADYEVPASGSSWIFEIAGAAEYGLSTGFFLVIDLAYRFCDVDEMTVTEDVNEASLEDGFDLEDHGRDVHFDYSGVKIGVGIKFGL